MNENNAQTIRIFSYSSRIGRVRYLVYPMLIGLLLIPIGIVAGILFAFDLQLLGAGVLILSYLFVLAMQVVFMVRRLHDLNRSGWWSLLYAAVILMGFVAGLGQFKGTMLGIYIFAIALGLIFGLLLLFWPGTQGENRFGPPPPPNSTAIVVGAWCLLLIPFFGGILAAIAIPAYQDFIARSQSVETHLLAEQARTAAVDYYVTNAKWPDDVAKVSDILPATSLSGRYTQSISFRTPNQGVFVVIATLKDQGVVTPLRDKSLEIWTSDDGGTWHCGPGGSDPAPARYLSPDCRDDGAP